MTLVPDPRRPAGWTLLVDGVPQSYVDLDDPRYLEFEYMRRLASIIDAAAPPGVPLRVLHLGGGALTMPRYVAATRPGSRQRVVELDAARAPVRQRDPGRRGRYRRPSGDPARGGGEPRSVPGPTAARRGTGRVRGRRPAGHRRRRGGLPGTPAAAAALSSVGA